MMSKPVLEVVGGRQLRATLRKAGDSLADLKSAHKAAATIAARSSAQIAPVRSGRLRSTIRASGTKTAGIVRVGNNSKAKYAMPIHWGWPRRNIASNPFVSTGAQDSEGRWIRVYEDYLDQAINTIKGA